MYVVYDGILYDGHHVWRYIRHSDVFHFPGHTMDVTKFILMGQNGKLFCLCYLYSSRSVRLLFHMSIKIHFSYIL